VRERSLTLVVLLVIALPIAFAVGCRKSTATSAVQPLYDPQTGRLRQLTYDSNRDGRVDIWSYMDGIRVLRVEADGNFDGVIDRWEYYGANQALEKVGTSRANDGTEDEWVYQGSDGRVARREISTRRDGRVTRTEFFEDGRLVRAEEDTDGNGRADKWEGYDGNVLTSLALDTVGRGTPTRRLEYGRNGAVKAIPLQ
jgi:hypothetical protein